MTINDFASQLLVPFPNLQAWLSAHPQEALTRLAGGVV